jgi:FlaA1/EpsC-like NDP-sugar epimerase
VDQDILERILGREEHSKLIWMCKEKVIEKYRGKNILITGGNGSLGNALADWFDEAGIDTYFLLDIELENNVPGRRIHSCNILKFDEIKTWIHNTIPHFIFHFAAGKHAPVGERDPWETTRVNIEGTENIIRAMKGFAAEDCNLILSSTCKSCLPETCYGATKLIADRMVLNAGGSVARYYNVVQSSGNVFEIWEKDGEPYFATDCYRYFISLDEAIALTIYAGITRGRFSVDPGEKRYIPDICNDIYENPEMMIIPRRRGDRKEEPVHGSNEQPVHEFSNIYRIENYNDEVRND